MKTFYNIKDYYKSTVKDDVIGKETKGICAPRPNHATLLWIMMLQNACFLLYVKNNTIAVQFDLMNQVIQINNIVKDHTFRHEKERIQILNHALHKENIFFHQNDGGLNEENEEFGACKATAQAK